MFKSGKPQMRQSEGNKTEKNPSVIQRSHRWGKHDELGTETIEHPATAVVAWPARIRSSLLLKTASSHSVDKNKVHGPVFVLQQYSGDPLP